MDRSDFEAWESRVRARADMLWRHAGRPESGIKTYLAQARELVAMEEVPVPTLDPERAVEPMVEEASIQGNLGEFPTLTDQGEEQTYPHVQNDDGPHLSDQDASDEGGVLPMEGEPSDDMSEISLADGDVTTSALNAEDEPENPDLNDDGMPDSDDLDAETRSDSDAEDGAVSRQLA